MLNKKFSTSMLVAVIAMLIGISSLNAQDMSKKEMMKKHQDMKQLMKSVDVAGMDANKDGKLFACTMGCEVKDVSGKCSGCEMDLKEMSLGDVSKLIDSKSFNKSDCGADCTKPCGVGKKGTAMMKVKKDKKDCGADCTKPCCASEKASNMKSNCSADCSKPCCSSEKTTTMKSNSECGPCCTKSCCN